MEEEITLADPKDTADESSRSSASGVRKSPRSPRPKVSFPDEVSDAPKKRPAKRTSEEASGAVSDSSVAEDASSKSSPSPKKQARSQSESKTRLCVYRNHAQEQVLEKDEDGEIVQAFLPWQMTAKKCDAIDLKSASGERTCIKAGDTVYLYALKKSDRSVPYSICWFEQEEGQKTWKVYAVNPANPDHAVRMPIAEIIKYISADPKTTEALREDAWRELTHRNKSALGAVDDVKRKRSKAARQYAARHASIALPHGGSAADLGDVLTRLEKHDQQYGKSLADFNRYLAVIPQYLADLKACQVQSARRLEDLDKLFTVALQSTFQMGSRK